MGHHPNEAATRLTKYILMTAQQYIPRRRLNEVSATYPWLTQASRDALRAKWDAEGTNEYERLRDACTTTLRREYFAYIRRVRKEIADLPRGSKKWWRLQGTLLQKKGKTAGIPPLKCSGGAWAMCGPEKARALADAFAGKATLPMQCGVPNLRDGPPSTDRFVALRQRVAVRVLETIGCGESDGA